MYHALARRDLPACLLACGIPGFVIPRKATAGGGGNRDTKKKIWWWWDEEEWEGQILMFHELFQECYLHFVLWVRVTQGWDRRCR